jgi:hypothetical protein
VVTNEPSPQPPGQDGALHKSASHTRKCFFYVVMSGISQVVRGACVPLGMKVNGGDLLS